MTLKLLQEYQVNVFIPHVLVMPKADRNTNTFFYCIDDFLSRYKRE
jgi:hypothetical protein